MDEVEDYWQEVLMWAHMGGHPDETEQEYLDHIEWVWSRILAHRYGPGAGCVGMGV